MMTKYTVGIPYIGWKYYEVEADSEEEASDKVFKQNDIESSLSLCWQCSEMIDSDLEMSEKDIFVEENQ